MSESELRHWVRLHQQENVDTPMALADFATVQAENKDLKKQVKHLESNFKTLFDTSKQSHSSRRIAQGMSRQDYPMGRYQARTLMKKLGLRIKAKPRFCKTTDS